MYRFTIAYLSIYEWSPPHASPVPLSPCVPIYVLLSDIVVVSLPATIKYYTRGLSGAWALGCGEKIIVGMPTRRHYLFDDNNNNEQIPIPIGLHTQTSINRIDHR